MADTVVQELVINTLTQAQFDAAKEAGTLSPYELYGTPDTSVRLPVLTPMWFDHIANDVSWLRADTFSWHSGDVYKAAYEHLADEHKGLSVVASGDILGEEKTYYRDSSKDTVSNTNFLPLYAWVANDGTITYTRELAPSVGSNALSATGSPTGTITESTAKSDTIGDITITYYLADDGHKICLPDQESNLAALYESTGVAWYYLLDQTNQQFKLPRTKWGFTGLRDSVGGYVAAGLPNIKGAFQADNAGFGNNTATGAFRTDTSISVKVRTTGDNSCNPKVSFDASRSSSVYGNSDTVQPKATQMYLYFFVGTFSQTATEQTAGLNAEMFNDLNAHRVVETQMPTANNGYTWYRKYADGWVEQGGCVTTSSTAGNATSVTFAIPMADNSYSAVGSRVVRATSGNGYQTAVAFSVYTTTGMKVHSGVASCTIAWQIRGMAA